MEILIVQWHERSRFVRAVASRIIRLETDWMVETKLQARLGNVELLFGFGTAWKNADKSCLLTILGLPLLDFEVDSASCTCLDAFGAPLQKAAIARGSPCHGEIRLGIIENLRLAASLPFGDLLLEPMAQRFGTERASIEENGVRARPAAKKVRKITCNCAVCGIGERPFPERGLRPGRAVVRVAFREKAIQRDRLNFCTTDARSERLAQQA